eukprot:TRINITY_DN10879_c1_g1_i2.p1 TRINITY_DN10879_c1_g1~~TRINITY_DN10879_c1_g1_i2.p1  ORF type:complete len:516 (+),score=137.51 TRINITY_DN10879_c1_g1_i2:155-1702(+)
MAAQPAAEEEIWDDWVEDEQSCPGIFDDRQHSSAQACLDATASDHGVNMLALKDKLALDQYGCIQLINYLRTTKDKDVNTKGREAFAADEYLKPVLENDPLLSYDYCPDDWSDDEDGFAAEVAHQAAPIDPTTLEGLSREGLLAKCRWLEEQLLKAQGLSSFDLSAVRQEQVLPTHAGDDIDVDESMFEAGLEDYFEGYGHYAIHEEMLKDGVRTESYRNYILKNPDMFKDKIVLDVGCGSGVLSMFAAQAGAKHVYAVDNSPILREAQEIIRENGMEDLITCIKGKIEEIRLPVEHVDIIVSEWMGYFLLFEAMLDSVLWARDKYLAPGGTMVPDQSTMYLVGMDAEGGYDDRIAYWDDVYGLKMNALKRQVLKESWVTVVKQEHVNTAPYAFRDINVAEVTVPELTFKVPFTLVISKQTRFAAFMSYFDITFDCNAKESVYFTTGPEGTPTHWQQVVLLLETPMDLHKGDVVKGDLTLARLTNNERGLKVTIDYEVVSLDHEHVPLQSQSWTV